MITVAVSVQDLPKKAYMDELQTARLVANNIHRALSDAGVNVVASKSDSKDQASDSDYFPLQASGKARIIIQ